jgi:nitrate reductase beta subunit
MFGPRVEEAIKTYRNAKSDPALAGLLGLFGSTEKVVPRWKHQDEWTIGYDENGAELVRVPLREPVHLRQAYDEKRAVARVNCP